MIFRLSSILVLIRSTWLLTSLMAGGKNDMSRRQALFSLSNDRVAVAGILLVAVWFSLLFPCCSDSDTMLVVAVVVMTVVGNNVAS